MDVAALGDEVAVVDVVLFDLVRDACVVVGVRLGL